MSIIFSRFLDLVRRSFFLLIILKSVGVVVASDSSEPPSPGVYAIIVGVSRNGSVEDWDDLSNLPKAGDNAELFARQVLGTFKSAKIWFLTDKGAPERSPVGVRPIGFPNNVEVLPATANSLRNVLVHKISRVPERSLIIFYFAGHGSSINTPAGREKVQQFLLMSGASESSLAENSISIRELLDAIAFRKQTFVAGFLDCCFSGPPPSELPFPVEDQAILDTRGFMLAATCSDYQALGGTLTDEVLNVLKNPDACQPVYKFIRHIKDVVYERSNKKMLPRDWFGQNIDQCLLKLDQPRTMLLFKFSRGSPPFVEFQIFDKVERKMHTHVYEPSLLTSRYRSLFPCLVPQHPIHVKIIDPPTKEVLLEVDIDSKNDVEEVEVPYPSFGRLSFLSRDANAQLAANTQLAAAEFIERYGADSSSAYFRVAQLFLQADPKANVIPYLRMAADKANSLPIYRLAVGHLDESELTAASKDPSLYITLLESVGQYGIAGDLAFNLANQKVHENQKNFLLYRATLSYSISGKLELSKRASEKINQSQLAVAQKNALRLILQSPASIIEEGYVNLAYSQSQFELIKDQEDLAVSIKLAQEKKKEVDGLEEKQRWYDKILFEKVLRPVVMPDK